MDLADYLKKLEGFYSQLDLSRPRNAPASMTQLRAVERELGAPLPTELRAAWLTADGLGSGQTAFARPGRLVGYDFFSVEAALREREGLRRRAPAYSQYDEPKARDSRSRAGWFHPGWLPFGGFGGGSLLLILDMAPSRVGVPGQIIAFSHDPDQLEHIAQSFELLLDDSIAAIESDPEELLGLP